MKVKVCGMRSEANSIALSTLPIDYIGFIFYKPSARYAGMQAPGWLNLLPNTLKKVGVFVNEPIQSISTISSHWQLDLIQLHGHESTDDCASIKQNTGLPIIKAFGIDHTFEPKHLSAYSNVVDYFLFDTKSPQYGGTGKAFDIGLIANLDVDLPYFLSGGIGPDFDFDALAELHKKPFAIDINSRFETKPGEKSIAEVTHFLSLKNQYEHSHHRQL